jgi:hypothetical protein
MASSGFPGFSSNQIYTFFILHTGAEDKKRQASEVVLEGASFFLVLSVY